MTTPVVDAPVDTAQVTSTTPSVPETNTANTTSGTTTTVEKNEGESSEEQRLKAVKQSAFLCVCAVNMV